MALPSAWVDKIFEKLSLVYGRDFAGRWEGLDLKAVKADWAHELGGFEVRPAAIKHALETIDPSRPPTVLQFRDLCAKAPVMNPPALPSPPANPAIVAQVLSGMKRPVGFDFKAWARRLRAREHRADRLTKFQRDAWRTALASEIAEENRTVEMQA